jgi:hypothetical protein
MELQIVWKNTAVDYIKVLCRNSLIEINLSIYGIYGTGFETGTSEMIKFVALFMA